MKENSYQLQNVLKKFQLFIKSVNYSKEHFNEWKSYVYLNLYIFPYPMELHIELVISKNKINVHIFPKTQSWVEWKKCNIEGG